MFEARQRDGVLALRRPDTRWLSTGWDGGFQEGPGAYNVSVPEGWERTDVGAYVRERLDRAGFEAPGPALLTGVHMRHARGARLDPAVAYATVGLSNPAALPMDPAGDEKRRGDGPATAGTVNLLVGTTRALDDAALASLLAVVVEAKTATLLQRTGFPGTTSDAVVVGTDPDGLPATFAGSATDAGDAARACVREAVTASLGARYADRAVPETVADAEYGVVTDRRAEVFVP